MVVRLRVAGTGVRVLALPIKIPFRTGKYSVCAKQKWNVRLIAGFQPVAPPFWIREFAGLTGFRGETRYSMGLAVSVEDVCYRFAVQVVFGLSGGAEDACAAV